MLEVLQLLCPYPTIGPDGLHRDGLFLPQPRVCLKCRAKPCRDRYSEIASAPINHATCEFSVSTVLVRTGLGPLLINGVFVVGENTAASPQQRKSLRQHKVTPTQLRAYSQRLEDSLPALQESLEQAASEAVSGQHDLRSAVSALQRNVEAVIADLPGESDYEKIEGADPRLKSLLKSASLLRSRLDLAPIVVNPEAASYGLKRRMPVYRAFHRMVHLFEQMGQLRGIRLRMAGQSTNVIRAFDSFELVPLVLIENAIKYAESGSEVVVRVDDWPPAECVVSVESKGRLVPPEERGRIFERGFRGQAAQAVAGGSGLGLYTANVVCQAHGCTLRYDARPFPGTDGVGINVFQITMAAER